MSPQQRLLSSSRASSSPKRCGHLEQQITHSRDSSVQADFSLSRNHSAHSQHFGGSSNSSLPGLRASFWQHHQPVQVSTQVSELSRPCHFLLAASTNFSSGQNHQHHMGQLHGWRRHSRLERRLSTSVPSVPLRCELTFSALCTL